jgi:hypothetical protein
MDLQTGAKPRGIPDFVPPRSQQSMRRLTWRRASKRCPSGPAVRMRPPSQDSGKGTAGGGSIAITSKVCTS